MDYSNAIALLNSIEYVANLGKQQPCQQNVKISYSHTDLTLELIKCIDCFGEEIPTECAVFDKETQRFFTLKGLTLIGEIKITKVDSHLYFFAPKVKNSLPYLELDKCVFCPAEDLPPINNYESNRLTDFDFKTYDFYKFFLEILPADYPQFTEIINYCLINDSTHYFEYTPDYFNHGQGFIDFAPVIYEYLSLPDHHPRQQLLASRMVKSLDYN